MKNVIVKKNFIDVVFNEIVDSEASNIKSQNAFDTLTVNSRKSFSDLSHDLSNALTEIAKNYSAYQKAKANIKYLPKTTLEDPCCQAEIARHLKKQKTKSLHMPISELWRHALHTREMGSHLTNVLRCLQLESQGYQVTVTELVGWEHSMKNEIIIAKCGLWSTGDHCNNKECSEA